jgi:hypothetical protein
VRRGVEAPSRIPVVVRLGDLDIAPENLRHGEPPDDGLPQLAQTSPPRASCSIRPSVPAGGERRFTWFWTGVAASWPCVS